MGPKENASVKFSLSVPFFERQFMLLPHIISRFVQTCCIRNTCSSIHSPQLPQIWSKASNKSKFLKKTAVFLYQNLNIKRMVIDMIDYNPVICRVIEIARAFFFLI